VPADLQAWEQCAAIISVGDEFCGGVLVELDAPLEEASRLLALAARSAIVRGFAARRTMTAAPVAAWLAATLSDEALIEDLAGRFRALAEVWYSARGHMPEGAERSAG
jgi:myo-inositol catabolism protein IolC